MIEFINYFIFEKEKRKIHTYLKNFKGIKSIIFILKSVKTSNSHLTLPMFITIFGSFLLFTQIYKKKITK
jgi:hypothetical protein